MSTTPAKRTWIGWSFVAGCCAGLPIGVVLSYVAFIPLYLGLFFFLLFGLLIGAIMFRFGRSAMPVRPGLLLLIAAAVVLIVWATTLVTEYAAFPGFAAARIEQSVEQTRRRHLRSEEETEISRQTRPYVMGQLLGRPYEGGVVDWLAGFPRYLRWMAQDGVMSCPRVIEASNYKLVMSQRGRSWAFRLILSMGLLAFSIISQYMLLTKPMKTRPAPDGSPSAAHPSLGVGGRPPASDR